MYCHRYQVGGKEIEHTFEENIDDATPGTAGEKNTELDDLEINITLKDTKDYFGLGKTIVKGIKEFKCKP